MIDRRLISLSFLMFLCLPLFAGDERLQDALTASNAGRKQEAIHILEQLKTATPSDMRVFQSLGLLYQSTGRYDEAISTLETAASMGGSPETFYALGLLYEAKALHNPGMKQDCQRRALDAWQKFLSQAGANDGRADVAQRHIRALSTPE